MLEFLSKMSLKLDYWTLALAITMFSAAVNLFAERAEEAEEDAGDGDEES